MNYELTPERQLIANEARKKAVLPMIDTIRHLFILGEPLEEADYEGESKNG